MIGFSRHQQHAPFCVTLVCSAFILNSCGISPQYWTEQNHLRNYEMLRVDGEVLQLQGRWAQAASSFQKALEEAEKNHASAIVLASSRNQLADALLQDGKTANAASEYNQAIKLYQHSGAATKGSNQLPPLARLDYANAVRGQGQTFLLNNRSQEAKDSFIRALSLYDNGDEGVLELHRLRDKALCLAGLACAYRQLGDKKKADETFTTALDSLEGRGCTRLREEILALSKSTTGTSGPNNSAALASGTAPTSQPETTKQSGSTKPTNKPDIGMLFAMTSRSTNNEPPTGGKEPTKFKGRGEWEVQWNTYHTARPAGDTAKAQTAILKCYDISKHYAISDMRRRASLTELSVWLATHNQQDLAKKYFEEEVELNRQNFGPDDRVMVLPLNRLAKMYLAKGDIARAEKLALEAKRITELPKNLKGCNTSRVQATLADIYLAKNDYQHCLKMLDEAMKGSAKYEDYGVLASEYRIQGGCYRKMNDLKASRKSYEECAKIADEHLTYGDQWRSFTILASACLRTKDLEEADANYTQAEQALTNAANGRRLREDARACAPEVFKSHAKMLELSGKSKRAHEVLDNLKQLLAS